MREIKFRAWDKERNVMMESDYFGIDEYITPEGRVVEKETHSGLGFSDMYMVDISDNRILMQYTGLTDRNGVGIYEGDIVKCFKLCNSKVLFKNGVFGLDGKKHIFYGFNDICGEIEVIGNIYENPELLK